jgi:Proton-conducting membrane transporter
VWLGTVTMLVGVLFAMIQHDAKRLLAFHTVSQIGYMMLGLGLGTPLGLTYVIAPALTALRLPPDLGVGWFGFTSDGGWFVTAGLALAVLSLVAGGAGYRVLARRAPRPVTAAVTATRTHAWAPRELVAVGAAASALQQVRPGVRVRRDHLRTRRGRPVRVVLRPVPLHLLRVLRGVLPGGVPAAGRGPGRLVHRRRRAGRDGHGRQAAP